MKKTLRFTSAALTLALAAGMALSAFAAAKPSFSKDETVYAVMAPDGSVTSTTVSAHLYNAAGLSGVTDRSAKNRVGHTVVLCSTLLYILYFIYSLYLIYS